MTRTKIGDGGGYASVNGLQLYYEIRGAGAPLVMLHGGLSTIGEFHRLVPTLAARRQIIAVERQGHGRTADIDRPLRFDQLAPRRGRAQSPSLGVGRDAFQLGDRTDVEHIFGDRPADPRRIEIGPSGQHGVRPGQGVQRLVEAVRTRGASKGLFGAKITGGGTGGTVAVFGRLDALRQHVPEIAFEYSRRIGQMPDIFEGTSPGAMEFGARRFVFGATGWRPVKP